MKRNSCLLKLVYLKSTHINFYLLAVFGADFVISTSITILSPATINCTDITIIADNVFEGFELFEVNISSVSLADVEYEMPSELDITIVNINGTVIIISDSHLSICNLFIFSCYCIIIVYRA